jgi:hypothetical protein
MNPIAVPVASIRALRVALTVALLVPMLTLEAQSPPGQDTISKLSASSARVCNAMAFIPSVQLLRGSTEAPFTASGVAVRDSLTGDTLYLGRADAKRPGWWLLFEQKVLPTDAVRNGRRVAIEISTPNQPLRTISRELGLDPTGCYIVLRGDRQIRL